jgi:hypothetical protein
LYKELDAKGSSNMDYDLISANRKIKFAILRQLWGTGRKDHAIFEVSINANVILLA